MMDFNTFIIVVKDNIISYMGEDYNNITPEISIFNKTNLENSHNLVLNLGGDVAPSINLEGMYEKYCEKYNGDFEKCMDALAEQFKAAIKDMPKKDFVTEVIKDRSRVFPMVINTDSNKELLKNVPHRDIEDMSVIYKILIRIDNNEGSLGTATCTIDNKMLESMYDGMSEADLFELAMENQAETFPSIFCSLGDHLRSLAMEDGMPEEVANSFFPDTPGMYILRNKGISGAASILDSEKMLEYKEMVGGDCYVLPSSIHEVIIVNKQSGMAPEDLANMVCDINVACVDETDRLSNNVYEISNTGKLVKATDTLNKGVKDMDYGNKEKNMTI